MIRLSQGVAVLGAFLLGSALGLAIMSSPSDDVAEPSGKVQISTAVSPPLSGGKIKIIAVGDIMLGRNVEVKMKKHGLDYPFEKVRDWFKTADVVFANLEGPIPAKHIPTVTGSTNFSFIPETTEILQRNGVSIVSVANNHSLDKGAKAYERTKEVLNAAGIVTVGHPNEYREDLIVVKEIKGQKFVFLAFSEAVNPKFDETKAIELVRKAGEDKEAFVIVSIHWGDEYRTIANKKQVRIAHAFVDAGADLVLGHHPHVVQNYEIYKDRLVFYSLGNFIFDQYFSEETQNGLAVELEIGEREVSAKLIPIDLHQSQPKPLEPKSDPIFLPI